ncbi:hypothetical protein J1614_000540 [Plenodomus biglobosus]|nr:hypothetical protein J1614_000540 [Plenodomus biglobosus]
MTSPPVMLHAQLRLMQGNAETFSRLLHVWVSATPPPPAEPHKAEAKDRIGPPPTHNGEKQNKRRCSRVPNTPHLAHHNPHYPSKLHSTLLASDTTENRAVDPW